MEKKTQILFDYFMKRYGSKLSNFELGYLKANFEKELDKYLVSDIALQIRSEIGLINPNGDYYQEHINKIRNNFDITGDILDVASGRIPSFANRIAKTQLKLRKGTITICDPCLIIDKVKYPNMLMHKMELTESTDLHRYDLITAILPCEATEIVLRRAITERKNFYIALCDCSHLEFKNSALHYMNTKQYHNYLIRLAQKLMAEHSQDHLEVEYLDERYTPVCPILYNKKR